MWLKRYINGKFNCRNGWISVTSTLQCFSSTMAKALTLPYCKTLSSYGSQPCLNTFTSTPKMTPLWSGTSCRLKKDPIKLFWKSILSNCFTPSLKKLSPEPLNATKCSLSSISLKLETFTMKNSFWLKIIYHWRKNSKKKRGLRRLTRISLSGKIRWRRKSRIGLLPMDGFLEKYLKNLTIKK